MGEGDLILFKEELFSSHKDTHGFFLLLINVMILSCVISFELFSQVSDVAHGPLVFLSNCFSSFVSDFSNQYPVNFSQLQNEV